MNIVHGMKTCELTPGCESPVEGRTNGCASCNRAARKAEKMISNFKVVNPVEKVSEKRAGELKEYYKLRQEYLIAFPCCEVEDCHLKVVDIHHMAGKENGRLNDVAHFMAVCRKHHNHIHDDTVNAKSKGYSVTRSKTI